MSDEITALTRAVEEKITTEIERVRLETERLAIETTRLDREMRNAKTLEENAAKIKNVLELLSADIIPSIKSQSTRIEVIFEFVKAISGWLYHQGDRETTRLNQLLESLGQPGSMKVEIKPSGDANIGDIFEGDKNIGSIDIVNIINEICEKIEADDVEEAENILNSLPRDALDIVLAALQSKFAVIKVVVEKIGEKIKLIKK